MNTLLIGANGQIGRHVVDKLKDHETIKLVAGVRKEDQYKDLEGRGITPAMVDLLKDSQHMVNVMKEHNIDRVVFSAGSGGKTGPDMTMMIDLDGAVKAIEAAKEAGVDQFIMVSAAHSGSRDFWSNGLQETETGNHYYAAKFYADLYLERSGLTYTILRPGVLLNEEGTGKVKIETAFPLDQAGDLQVPRPDVADIIIESLGNDKVKNQTFEITTGDTTIKEALDNISK